MNKYLLMSAAAIMASAATAAAASNDSKSATGSGTFYQVSASGVTYCDADYLRWHGSNYFSLYDNETEFCGASVNGVGQGIAGKTKGVGKQVDNSDVFFTGEAISLTFSTPIKSGGVWTLWFGTGFSTFEINSGNYYPGVPHARGGKQMSNHKAVEQFVKHVKG